METVQTKWGARLLHWVFKIKNLKNVLSILDKEFNVKVLRHEEFGSVCEATCNGDFKNAWSKTMAGLGDEKTHFALELVYNYGVDDYKKHFGFHSLEFYSQNGEETKYVDIENYKFLKMNKSYFKNYEYVINDYQSENHSDEFKFISLRVNNLQEAVNYYTNVLEMTLFSGKSVDLSTHPKKSNLSNEFILNNSSKFAILGYSKDQSLLKLVEVEQPIVQDEDSGRMAYSCTKPCTEIKTVIDSKSYKILHQPVVLKTEGKADVKVVILQDPSDYEICFVEKEGFDDLCTTKQGDEIIDWIQRENNLKQLEFTKSLNSKN